MPATCTRRPDPARYAAYFQPYLDQVTEPEVMAVLEAQRAEVAELASLDPALATHRYEPGKWTVAEVLAHINDTERVFGYRMLRLARGDTLELNGFEQDDWIDQGEAGRVPLTELVAEFDAIRASTLALVRGLSDEAIERGGQADGKPLTVGSLLWLTAGHARHHLRVLRERYL